MAARKGSENRARGEARFWATVEGRGTTSGCWLWSGRVDKSGLGSIRVNNHRSLVHHYSLELHTGERPPRHARVVQACGNHRCVRPSHLELSTVASRLREHTEPSGVMGGCDLWTGYKNLDGYGQMRVGGRMVGAHRVAWELEHGPVPKGLLVLHQCDTPPCVTPGHLRVGTDADNAADRALRRRGADMRGESHWNAKLTDADVRSIRSLYAAGGGTMRDLGMPYGITPQTVWTIVHRTGWPHIV